MNQDDLWENDPYLVPKTPERLRQIHDMLFRKWKADGITPESPFLDNCDPALKAGYSEWLKTAE